MKGRILFAIALLAASAVAAGKSYTLTLLGTDTVGTTAFKPGSYRMEVGDQKLVIHNGKQTTEVPVKVETNDSRYPETTVRVEMVNGMRKVSEIHLGGTKTRLVLSEGAGGSNPASLR
jgi:hypothetical protein